MSVHKGNQGKFTKHVGVYNSKRCVVILQLPEDPQNVHIVDTDALPDQYHQGLIDVVQSSEGQAARWLGDVLARKMFADGTNALRTLYEKNYVAVVPVSLVTLTPLPNQPVPLADVLAQFQDPLAAQQSPQEKQFADIVAQEQQKLNESLKQDDPNLARHNQHMENLSGDKTEQNTMIASNLIAEAELLEAEAQRKRNQAKQFQEVAKKKSSVADTSEDGLKKNKEGRFIDPETGKTYKSAATLKGVMTKRANKAK